MKKIIVLVLYLVLISILVSCNNYSSFKAKVLEVNNSIFVQPFEDTNEYKSSDKIIIHINNCKIINMNNEDININEIKTGDIIKIYYDGMILESYPAQIKGCKIIIKQ